MNDTNLDRFVQAQDGVYENALSELRRGEKRTHWMWFIFPQIAGLGRSEMAQRYAITGLGEARAYLSHPLLGPRLKACTEALLAHSDKSAREIMGFPDDLKLRSSMTLFSLAAAEEDSSFHRVLARFFPEGPDEQTVERLR